ncbi:hypothetical protein [Streptomyces sp. NPDC002573]|uniref:hypothetical protein n=1 Tax=Streptomyces sp. NPDC002573 TaxID=3364651 RepID=UPI0036B0F2E1
MTHPPHWRQRLTAAATAAGTLALTLALLAGMPYVLWQAAGVPWPDYVSSLNEFAQRLSQPVSDPLMIDLLAVVGWVCWAAFASTVVRETIWYTTHLPQLIRNRHAHHEHVATLSMKGSLAALCIGTLVLALIGLCRPQPASAQQPPPRAIYERTLRRQPLSLPTRLHSPPVPPKPPRSPLKSRPAGSVRHLPRNLDKPRKSGTSSTPLMRATPSGTSRTSTWATASTGRASTRSTRTASKATAPNSPTRTSSDPGGN